VLAVRAYRGLATAVGPVVARETLREVRSLPLDEAAALISALHRELSREREDALEAQRALRLIAAEPGDSAGGAERRAGEDSMTITELAGALGVRASTLRFWEEADLVAPERVTSLAARRYPARRYPPTAIREARITAALRAAGYRIREVQATIASIRRLDDLDSPLETLRARLDTIARKTLALLDAGTDITALIRVNEGAQS
jgi:DNA-binding transcriptional MerR regulator